MTRLEVREVELGLPPLHSALLDASPPFTPGFRGYFVEGHKIIPEAAGSALHRPEVPGATALPAADTPLMPRRATSESDGQRTKRSLLTELSKEDPTSAPLSQSAPFAAMRSWCAASNSANAAWRTNFCSDGFGFSVALNFVQVESVAAFYADLDSPSNRVRMIY
eukprot:3926276-Pleurochrysis_carterae.AAC.5